LKTTIPYCLLALLLPAGAHVKPERRSNETEIRQHIVGEWNLSPKSDQKWYPKIIIAEDGRFIVILNNGRPELLGKWELGGQLLRVTPTAARHASQLASGASLNGREYFPVIYVDAHELVMAPGISVTGRWRFTR
jgi:hypothetical protein